MIYLKLEEAKHKFHQLEIKKTGRNSFAKYDYLQLQDFIKPVVEIMHDFKLVSFCSFTNELATLTVVDTEDNTQIQITSPMSTAQLKGCHEVQNLGAVQTYIRRYLYNALLDIVEGDAIDGSEPIKEPTKPTRSEMDKLAKIADGKGITYDMLEEYSKKKFGVPFTKINTHQYVDMLKHVSAKE